MRRVSLCATIIRFPPNVATRALNLRMFILLGYTRTPQMIHILSVLPASSCLGNRYLQVANFVWLDLIPFVTILEEDTTEPWT